MLVKYTGKIRRRIEGLGYVRPGEIIEMKNDLAARFCVKGADFIWVKTKKKKYNAAHYKTPETRKSAGPGSGKKKKRR